jgi:hypothetical protein
MLSDGRVNCSAMAASTHLAKDPPEPPNDSDWNQLWSDVRPDMCCLVWTVWRHMSAAIAERGFECTANARFHSGYSSFQVSRGQSVRNVIGVLFPPRLPGVAVSLRPNDHADRIPIRDHFSGRAKWDPTKREWLIAVDSLGDIPDMDETIDFVIEHQPD